MHTQSEVYLKIQVSELWLSYLLFIMFFTAPLGALLSAVKYIQYKQLTDDGDLDDYTRDLMLSHYSWLLRTFAMTVILLMVAVGTLYFALGYIIAIAAFSWWVYRLGRGVVALIEHSAVTGTD